MRWPVYALLPSVSSKETEAFLTMLDVVDRRNVPMTAFRTSATNATMMLRLKDKTSERLDGNLGSGAL